MKCYFENRTVGLTSSDSYSLEAGPWLWVNMDWFVVGLFLSLSEILDSGQPVMAEEFYKF